MKTYIGAALVGFLVGLGVLAIWLNWPFPFGMFLASPAAFLSMAIAKAFAFPDKIFFGLLPIMIVLQYIAYAITIRGLRRQGRITLVAILVAAHLVTIYGFILVKNS